MACTRQCTKHTWPRMTMATGIFFLGHQRLNSAMQTPYCFCFFTSQKSFVTRIWRVRIINAGICMREERKAYQGYLMVAAPAAKECPRHFQSTVVLAMSTAIPFLLTPNRHSYLVSVPLSPGFQTLNRDRASVKFRIT